MAATSRSSRKKEVNVAPQEESSSSVGANVTITAIPPYMIQAYHQYISYIASGRVACNYLDGFKNIQRRILYAALQICRKNNVKSARLDGETIGKYSPHGSCYDSIVGLVSNGMLIPKGSFENRMGVENEPAAAERYTEVRLNPITEILFMNKELLPHVDYMETELSTVEDKYYEPLFLPALLPGVYTAISESSEFDSGMALKLSLKYPRYSVLSLLNYTIHYLETKTFDPSLLYYQFHNIIKKATFDRTSKFDIEFRCPISVDEHDNVHLLSTLPFTDMSTLLKDIPFEDHTNTKTDIVFHKKYYDPTMFTSTAHFNMKAYETSNNDYQNVILHDYPIQYAMIVLLTNLEKVLFPRYFKKRIDDVNKQIQEYQLLKVVHEKYVVNHVPYDSLTDDEKSCASRHTTSAFMTIDKKLNEFNEELKVLVHRSNNIPKEIITLYKDAKESIIKYLTKYYSDNQIQIYDVS